MRVNDSSANTWFHFLSLRNCFFCYVITYYPDCELHLNAYKHLFLKLKASFRSYLMTVFTIPLFLTSWLVLQENMHYNPLCVWFLHYRFPLGRVINCLNRTFILRSIVRSHLFRSFRTLNGIKGIETTLSRYKLMRWKTSPQDDKTRWLFLANGRRIFIIDAGLPLCQGSLGFIFGLFIGICNAVMSHTIRFCYVGLLLGDNNSVSSRRTCFMIFCQAICMEIISVGTPKQN